MSEEEPTTLKGIIDPQALLKSLDVRPLNFIQKLIEQQEETGEGDFCLNELIKFYPDEIAIGEILLNDERKQAIKDELWDEIREDPEFKSQNKADYTEEIKKELEGNIEFLTTSFETLDEDEQKTVLERSGVLRDLIETMVRSLIESYPNPTKMVLKELAKRDFEPY